jgi:hypothetical protein
MKIPEAYPDLDALKSAAFQCPLQPGSVTLMPS